MELALYFANTEHLSDLDEIERPAAAAPVPAHILTAIIDCDTNLEYLQNLRTRRWLQLFAERDAEITRLYFGQEFCEHLIPDVAELRTALGFARQLGWGFTYVTGCLPDAALDQVLANLEFLRREGVDAEVVVNDWGLLSVMEREFGEFERVLGRLMVKQQRLARFVGTPPPVNMCEIRAAEEEIRANQLSAMRSPNLDNAAYRRELARLGITRFELDIVPEGVELPPDAWGFAVSCYFPWTYVTGARNCLTAGTVDSWREHVVVDGPCPRPCQEINRAVVSGQAHGTTLQRGNTVFSLSTTLAPLYFEGAVPVDRVVIQPYIPL